MCLVLEQHASICSLGRSSRIDSSGGSGDSEVQRTMLELLNQLDGFDSLGQVKMIMATNRPDVLGVPVGLLRQAPLCQPFIRLPSIYFLDCHAFPIICTPKAALGYLMNF